MVFFVGTAPGSPEDPGNDDCRQYPGVTSHHAKRFWQSFSFPDTSNISQSYCREPALHHSRDRRAFSENFGVWQSFSFQPAKTVCLRARLIESFAFFPREATAPRLSSLVIRECRPLWGRAREAPPRRRHTFHATPRPLFWKNMHKLHASSTILGDGGDFTSNTTTTTSFTGYSRPFEVPAKHPASQKNNTAMKRVSSLPVMSLQSGGPAPGSQEMRDMFFVRQDAVNFNASYGTPVREVSEEGTKG